MSERKFGTGSPEDAAVNNVPEQNQESLRREEFESLFGNLEKAAKDLEALAFEDDLTGLDNRKGLASKLDLLSEQLKRGQIKSIHALFVDLDNFKKINSDYGYGSGDIAIKVFAERLKTLFRGSDVVGRWGGDEFIVLLTNTDAKAIKERLEESVRPAINQPFEVNKPAEKNQPAETVELQMNMSAGLVQLTAKDFEKEGAKILERIAGSAGEAVKVAKDMGKGRTVEYELPAAA